MDLFCLLSVFSEARWVQGFDLFCLMPPTVPDARWALSTSAGSVNILSGRHLTPIAQMRKLRTLKCSDPSKLTRPVSSRTWVWTQADLAHKFSSLQSLVVSDSLWPHERSTPGLPVHHQLPELTQTHVNWVGDAIQPSRPPSSPSLPTFNLPQQAHKLEAVFTLLGCQLQSCHK